MTELIAQRLAGLLPDPSVRDLLLQMFFDSMRFIRDRKSDWSLVHTTAGSLRLFAGRLIVLTLHKDEAWLATASSEGSTLSALASWRWDTKSYPEYRRVPSRNGYYTPAKDVSGDWLAIRERHFAYLEQALAPGVAPDPRSTAKHEVDVVTYLDAHFGGGSEPMGGSIPEFEFSALEGEPRLFLHFRRERDPSLVRAKRAATRNSSGLLECEVCTFVAQDAYPIVPGGELCEVHHRSPLGELGAASVETRLEDLAILCPNCHRAIHQTRPMMTVDEFRDRFRGRQV